MREFQVNKFITLRLENGRTNIYVKRKLFRFCTILLLDIPAKNISEFNDIQSIDELSDNKDFDVRNPSNNSNSIPLDVIFWGHCSNLQVWAENDYDSRLLHRSLAFPLLKKLYESGDPLAKRAFKEEVARRFLSNHAQTTEYLLNEGFLDYLNYNELEILIEESDFKVRPLRDLMESINSGHFNDLNRLELLFYAKIKEFALVNISIEFLNFFFKFIDEGIHLGFIYNNRSILRNLIFPIIDRISKDKDNIKDFFLEELNKRLKHSNMYNFEILKELKEVYTTGYRHQLSLDRFLLK